MELTDAQRAQVYRELAAALFDHAYYHQEDLERMADRLDPPRPKPGTVVWFQQSKAGPWELGMVVIDENYSEDEPVVVSAFDGYTFAQLSTWQPAPIPDEDGYCVKDGKLHKLVEVPSSGDSYYCVGKVSQWIEQVDRARLERKEQEYV
jgi:hypothetical protein